MARGRMINRSISSSDKVHALLERSGLPGLLVFSWLLAYLDVNGNVKADPYYLKGEVFPRIPDEQLSPSAIREVLEALASEDVGLAISYRERGIPYLHFPGFRDEQVGLRAERERPEWPEIGPDQLDAFRSASGEHPDSVRQASGKMPAPEVRSGEVQKEHHLNQNGDGGYPDAFEALWEARPRRKSNDPKKSAFKAWKARVRSGVDPDELLRATKAYHVHCRREKKLRTNFVLQTRTFLGPDERWKEWLDAEGEDGDSGRFNHLEDGEEF